MNARGAWICVVASAAALSCRPDDQRTETMDPVKAMQARANMPKEVVAQLDSGTSAFRADDLAEALRHYTRVTELAPDVAAGWFGVYMAQDALGDDAAAAAALKRAQAVVPGATLLHDGSGGGP